MLRVWRGGFPGDYCLGAFNSLSMKAMLTEDVGVPISLFIVGPGA